MGKINYKINELAKGFLSAFLRDERIFKKFRNKITIFDFDSIQKGLNFIIEKSLFHYHQYNFLPSQEFLKFEIEKSNMGEDVKNILIKVIDEIFIIDIQKYAFLVDSFRDEMVKLLLKSSIVDIEKKLLNSDNIEGLLYQLIKDTREAQKFYLQEQLWDYAESFPEREAERLNRRNNPNSMKILKTGIKDLDNQLQIVPGTITAFLAPFKRYKSITLTHMGWAALLQGYNVYHIHFEGRKDMWESRYDARFTNVDYTKITSMIRSSNEEERIKNIMSRVNSWKQRLFLAKGIANQTSIEDIELQIENILIERNIKIDVIIIDYFQVMGPSSIRRLKGEDDWILQGNIAWDLVELANKPNEERIVIGALQTTRSGALDSKSLKSGQAGRSVIYSQAIDNLIAINQTEDELREGIIRYSPLFIRDGEIKKDHCKVESELWKIKIAKEADVLWDEVL